MRQLNVPWRLVLLLGAFALIRPILRITGIASEDGPLHPAAAASGATALITVVWIVAVVQARAARPVLTLVLAGLVYMVLSSLLAGVLSPIIDGEFQGPLANPIAIPVLLILNAAWGALAGCLAWAVLAVRGRNAR